MFSMSRRTLAQPRNFPSITIVSLMLIRSKLHGSVRIPKMSSCKPWLVIWSGWRLDVTSKAAPEAMSSSNTPAKMHSKEYAQSRLCARTMPGDKGISIEHNVSEKPLGSIYRCLFTAIKVQIVRIWSADAPDLTGARLWNSLCRFMVLIGRHGWIMVAADP